MDNMNYQSADIFSGQLPFSLEAEQSVLGAILIDSSCLPRIMDYVKPESFFVEKHRLIFEIMLAKFTTSQVIDIITVLDAVKSEGVFQTAEDAKIYLAQLAQVVPSTSHIESYAKIVQEKHYLRSLILAAKEIIENSSSPGVEAAELIDSAEQRIFEIRQGRESRGLVPISQIIMSTYDTLQKLSGEDKSQYIGTSTGFSALDSIITGLNKSDLILLAARPAMGKTSFALNIATNVAIKANKKVAIFSLEMGREQLVSRMLSSEALVQSSLMRTGNLKQEDWIKLAMSAQILAKAPIYLDDTPSITVAEMKGKLRRIKDLGLVVIDYLQLMTTGRRSDNRVQEVAEITRSLKIMAKELNV
ncbi:MAG TPA: replicative DNA helicase, partial [Ruminococcaceae bacterium]|nr:replicative DNA helicase [Oscillospiraceae bacterium]